MKKYFTQGLVLVGIVVGLISCQKEGLTYTEKRLLGTWNYTKVNFTKKWSLKSNDLMHDFAPISISFYSDFTARYIDAKKMDTLNGVWELTENCGEEESFDNLYVSLQNVASNELKQLVFEDCSITNGRLRSTYQNSEGLFRYVLRK